MVATLSALKVFRLKAITRITKTPAFTNFLNLGLIQLSNMLLQVLMFPVITRIVGIEPFGMVMLASTFAGLIGIIINFGTNQSGVKHIAVYKNDPKALSSAFSNTFCIRAAIFAIFLLFFFLMQWAEIRYYSFLVFALPLVLAEVLNPLFFFLGYERLKVYNVSNLVSKFVILTLIISFVNGPADAKWVNFIMGSVTSLTFAGLILHAARNFGVTFRKPAGSDLLKLGKENFYLTGNNLSVYLQQSLMIFALAKWGSPAWLGAYSLCDKVIWSVKLLIMTVSNAVYPKAASLYHEGRRSWKTFMAAMKVRITVVFSLISLLLFVFADFVIEILSGEPNGAAVIFLRLMAFLPAIAALNSLNVLNLLIRNANRSIFRIGLVMLIAAAATAVLLVSSGQFRLFGAYTLIIELGALLMYEYTIKQANHRSPAPN